ncbi:hypothetical protein TNCV_1685281 [Trichonephila clavipes]|nr:hypothetical protein TNCV_1685281 [Trichonephila clavipes]
MAFAPRQNIRSHGLICQSDSDQQTVTRHPPYSVPQHRAVVTDQSVVSIFGTPSMEFDTRSHTVTQKSIGALVMT